MEKKNYILLFLQIAAIAVSGVFGGDTTFALITALIGITFNFLVSMNIASGFLFGFVYAVCNGILAWQTNVYATFVFMIFMQAPMALYSFWKWHGKKKETEAIMKKMDRRELTSMVVGAIVLFVIMTGILSAINGAFNANVLFDTFFFVCSVTASVLPVIFSCVRGGSCPHIMKPSFSCHYACHARLISFLLLKLISSTFREHPFSRRSAPL